MKNTRYSHKPSKKNLTKKDEALKKALKSSFLGILITSGISLALLFASTAAALMTDDPTAFIEPTGYVSALVTAFLGGFICSKIDKQSPYLVGIISGAGFVIISVLLSFTLPHSLASGMNIWLRLCLHAITFILFPIGTLIGIKSSKPKHKVRKRR